MLTMTSSHKSKYAIRKLAKPNINDHQPGNLSKTFLERFYESQLDKTLKKEEAKMVTKLNKSIFTSVVNRLEPLSSSSSQNLPGETSPETGTMETVDEQHSMVRVTYKSGNVFEGRMSKWSPHGVGRLFFNNGATIYEGQFKDGLPDGGGIVRWSDSSWYEGEFHRGLRHGRGLHVSAADGRRWYGGQWSNGRRNGRGKTACADKSDGALDYDGDWVDGRPHGTGTGSWPDGSLYTGDWADGRPHGRGQTVWPQNDVYDGHWVDGYMDGTGTYEWSSNPRDRDQLVLCLCDKYTGQWSKSKKHGPGVFYSEETGSTIRSHWVDDALDGPCEIDLYNGKTVDSPGLVFRRNVLYGPPPPPPVPPTARTTGRGHKLSVSTTVGRDRSRTTIQPETRALQFQRPCEPRLVFGAGNNVRNSKDCSSPCLVRANIRLTGAAHEWTMCDLTGHVQKMAAKCSKNVEHGYESNAADSPNVVSELRAAQLALNAYSGRLDELYIAYGAFLANGPVAYRPTMTRLGLWQILVDNQLHAVLSLADFDDLLYENGNYAFKSAHDPFEPVHFWQFVHAVCELAIVVCDTRRARSQKAVGDRGTMASALHVLLAEHVKADAVVPVSYAVTGGGEPWMNSRKTITRMYEVYRAMVTAESLPTARLLIRLCGPKFNSKPSPSLDSVLPVVLDIMFGLQDEHADWPYSATSNRKTLFECTVESVVSLLSQACPRIMDGRGVLVDVETRLTFAEWYRFVLLCVRDSRQVPQQDNEPLPQEEIDN